MRYFIYMILVVFFYSIYYYFPIINGEKVDVVESYEKYLNELTENSEIYVNDNAFISKIDIKKNTLVLNVVLSENYFQNQYLISHNLPKDFDIDEIDNRDLSNYVKNVGINNLNYFCKESIFSKDIYNLLNLKINYKYEDEDEIVLTKDISKSTCLLEDIKKLL